MQGEVIHGMDIREYHRHPSYSKTDIVRAYRSTQYVFDMRTKARESSPAKDMGSAVHMLVLEPHLADSGIFYSSAGSRRGKVWDADVADHPRAIVLLEKEKPIVDAMVASIMNHPMAGRVVQEGRAESSFFCELEFAGYRLPVKCRPDFLPGTLMAIDIKTTRNVAPEGFGKDSYNYHYHWSAWLTSRILEKITGHRHIYYFVAVENTYPFETVMYQARPNVIALAEIEIEPVLRRLAQDHCQDRFHPIADDTVLDLELPAWAYRRMNNV